MKEPLNILVLQGGGALGAYQAGVYESLAAHHAEPQWVVGTSIGAINAAIIAGNRPADRVEKLHQFWDLVAQPAPSFAPGTPDSGSMMEAFGLGAAPLTGLLNPWVHKSQEWQTLVHGIDGFFLPRPGVLWRGLETEVAPGEASFYDTAPLAQTLHELVDFDDLNNGPVRFTAVAVNVATGRPRHFDSLRDGNPITAEHVMASGALPPGFPPVQIDGQWYWDGGLSTNTPLDVVLQDSERRDMLCFMIDLWDDTEPVPRSLAGVMTREKTVRFASRSYELLQSHALRQDLRRAVRLLSEELERCGKSNTHIKHLAELGCGSRINVVRLVMKALRDDDQMKDIDFRRPTLAERWHAGRSDGDRALQRKDWLRTLPPDTGLAIHELEQVEDHSATV